MVAIADDLAALDGITPIMLVTFGHNGIKTLDDLGDLASDELIELLGDIAPTAIYADAIIMAARAHWFEDEEAPAAAAEAAGET